MMRGRKGQRDTKPTRLHSMNDIPRDGYTGFPRAWQMSQEKRRWLPPGMADVSRDAPLGGFRAEASITGNTSAYADIAGYDDGLHCRSGYKGGCVVTGPYHTDIDGQLSSAGKYMNTET